MATITPTVSGFRWGPKAWQIADYKAHPTRDSIVGNNWRNPKGNPVLIFRHSGGGTSGNLREVWDVAQPYNALFEYLLDPARSFHFDIISVQTGQRGIYDSAQGSPGIKRTEKMFLLDGVVDFKRAVGALKFWMRRFNNTTGYAMDPTKIVSGGHSFGATQSALAMLSPLVVPNNLSTGIRSNTDTDNYDSSVCGNLFISGQVDCRTIAGTNYMDPLLLSGWAGTSLTDNTEYALVSDFVKEGMSVRGQIENYGYATYKPMYISYEKTGAHTYPLADAHDSQQGTDLQQTILAAGLECVLDLWSNPTPHKMPTASIVGAYQFLVDCVDPSWRTAGDAT